MDHGTIRTARRDFHRLAGAALGGLALGAAGRTPCSDACLAIELRSIMSRKLISLALAGVVSVPGWLLAGCASKGSHQPYRLTEKDDDQPPRRDDGERHRRAGSAA